MQSSSRKRLVSQWPRGLTAAPHSHSSRSMKSEGPYVASTTELTRKQVR
ncbi:hypothetical protein ANCCAN_00723 [Ancylostoma caninum]|uniref:Uncharacterized protein n=1 Tax=Ancylostoma caninum TaxID=29170 RepID=A0A368HC08_ANCCA|nr:hypothetical protein ANCCAN_00723 [Ancylostoma caninum]